jgi:perosamine synthetase
MKQTLIRHNKPSTGKEEAEAVQKPLLTQWIASGPKTHEFEASLQKYIGAQYAVAVNSGTSALHLGLIALGVKPGDEIILPTYTAPSLLNDISYVNAKPVLVDVKENDCNINASQIAKKISKKTKVIIAPHTFGIPMDIKKIKQFGIPVIEDCAQALGARFSGKSVGTEGDIGTFSFNATKMITTGQGGMVVTGNKQLYDDIKDLLKYSDRKNKAIKYSYNYELNDILASVGLAQFKKLPYFLKRREEIAKRYADVIKKKYISYLPADKSGANILRFIIKTDSESTKNKVKQQFLKAGIEIKEPLLEQELLHNIMGEKKEKFPMAEKLIQTLLSFPIYPGLTDREISTIIAAMEKIL